MRIDRRAPPAVLAAALAISIPAAVAPPAARAAAAGGEPVESVVLLTLDTTRADHLGAYGARGARTPALDALAARGTRYARAITASPLTLPAHASLLTGLAPPEHGIADNGVAALGADVPTLATALAGRGWAAGAFVASRVLDRRFGLARGFAVYDDRMAAEVTGEYGYPERDAAAVVDAALAWAKTLPAGRRYLLWAHFYDPHAPYTPPPEFAGGTPERDYAGEIAYVDREIGRLLAGLPGAPGRRLVVAVGDHGEGLGEHGERGHGIFLYRATLEVPLILAGPGVPAGATVAETVGTQRLPATLLALAGTPGAGLAATEPPLPGLGLGRAEPAPRPVFSETRMPASAYGWAPLSAVTDGGWRLIVAPRPELYDVAADPGEGANLLDTRRDDARRLKRALDALEAGFVRREAARPESDPQLAASLRSLGYLSGSSGDGRARANAIDPKDGIHWLAEFDRAKELLGAGRAAEASAALAALVAKNPENVPFLSQLARAQLASGAVEEGLATYRRAVAKNPGLDFLHLNLAVALRQAGRPEEARREFELVVELNPRAANAWLSLAEMAHQAKDDAGEKRLLEAAVAAGTASAIIHVRLGQIETLAGRTEAGDAHFRAATDLAPGWAGPWLLWGQLAESHGRPAQAVERYRQAVARDPGDPVALLRLGKALKAAGQAAEARGYLERAAAAGGNSPAGREARGLLAAP